jgi:hypothetical protein
LAPIAIENIKILGPVLEQPAKQHCQFSPFGPIFEVNGLDWQLHGSFKTAPRILIFSRRPHFSSIIIHSWLSCFKKSLLK